MTFRSITLMSCAGLIALPPVAFRANAAGCLSGAVAGAVVGHVAGHHAVLGAAGGCVAGHEIGKHQKAQQAQQQQLAAPKPQ